jgi:AcrR family transcriptional regulator
VEAAGRLADERGTGALSLAALAQVLGVALPSLYKHIGGLDDLRRRVAVAAMDELGAALRDAAAGRSGSDALAAVAAAYRDFAIAHPGRYAVTQSVAGAEESVAAAAARAAEPVYAVLRGFGLSGDALIDATRTLRAALHGFVLLETGGGFGMDRPTGESFDRMVAALSATLAAWPAR